MYVTIAIILNMLMMVKTVPYHYEVIRSPGIYFQEVKPLQYLTDTWEADFKIDYDQIITDEHKIRSNLHDLEEENLELIIERQETLHQMNQLKTTLEIVEDLQKQLQIYRTIIPEKSTELKTTPEILTKGIISRIHNIGNSQDKVDQLYQTLINAIREPTIKVQELQNKIELWIYNAENILRSHTVVLNQLINIIQDIEYKKINPALLSQEEVIELIKYINNRKGNFKVPQFEVYSNQLSKFIKIKPSRNENTLIFNIQFLLASPMVNEIYHMYTVPIFQENGQTISVKPRKPYIIMNKLLTQHAYLTQEEYNKCLETRESLFCEPPTFIYTHPTCEYEILNKNHQQNCNAETNNKMDTIWIQLHETNQWIHSSPTPESITLNCLNERDIKLEINNTGILTVNTDCNIKTKYFTFKASKGRFVKERIFNSDKILSLLGDSSHKIGKDILIILLLLGFLISISIVIYLVKKYIIIKNENLDSNTYQAAEDNNLITNSVTPILKKVTFNLASKIDNTPSTSLPPLLESPV